MCLSQLLYHEQVSLAGKRKLFAKLIYYFQLNTILWKHHVVKIDYLISKLSARQTRGHHQR